MQKLMDGFFKADNLTSSIESMIITLQKCNDDAFCIVFIKLLNDSISAAVDDKGIIPFHDSPEIKLLFQHMCRQQLHTVIDVINSFIGRDYSITSSKMGFGVYLRDLGVEIRADPREVVHSLFVILNRLGTGSVNGERWQKISPIIYRRIFASSVLPASVLLDAQKRIALLRQNSEVNEDGSGV